MHPAILLEASYREYVFPLAGIIHQMKGEYEAALKLHKAHLSFAQELSDYAAQGRAFGNMGNAYHAMGVFDQAVRYHRQELQISLEVSFLHSSPATCRLQAAWVLELHYGIFG